MMMWSIFGNILSCLPGCRGLLVFRCRWCPLLRFPYKRPLLVLLWSLLLRSRCSLSFVLVRQCFLDVFVRLACRSCPLIISITAISNLSLTEDSTWSFLRDLVQDHAILFVHAAPPCGTCSAARSIKRKGVSAAPLRSPQHPMGLPSLQGSNLDKVVAANKIYVGLANFLDLLCSLKIPWTVENPDPVCCGSCPALSTLSEHTRGSASTCVVTVELV